MSRTAKFNVSCIATYESQLDIPDEIEEGKELPYILEHLDKCNPTAELEWLNDLDDEPVIQDDIFAIELKQV